MSVGSPELGCKPPTAEAGNLYRSTHAARLSEAGPLSFGAAPEADGAKTPPTRRAEGRPNRSRKERETSSQNGFSQNVNSGIFVV